MTENLRVHWVWPSKYKEKWCFSPKCVFSSEMDHHTALKLVPLWSSHLITSECTEFGSLNTKRKWCFSPKCVFSEMGSSYSFETCTIVIIRPENLRVHWVWPSNHKEKWCFIPKFVFFSELVHHTGLKLVPLQLAWLKISGTQFGPLNTKKSLAQNVCF